jgi:hypothetical protein
MILFDDVSRILTSTPLKKNSLEAYMRLAAEEAEASLSALKSEPAVAGSEYNVTRQRGWLRPH